MDSRTILIVEDQRDFRVLLETKLTEAGYRVITAATGREAAKAMADSAPDLILTDLLMPDRDGIEIIHDLRVVRSGLPVIAMSGGGKMPAAFYLKLARTLGAKAILEKPFSDQQLLMTIGLALSETGENGP